MRDFSMFFYFFDIFEEPIRENGLGFITEEELNIFYPLAKFRVEESIYD